jgi:pimeloyl-ACP methyl ester carboxylesterase
MRKKGAVMDAVILVPGIMGSSLTLSGQEVWPPNFGEVLSHYKRLNLLLDDRVREKKIIESVLIPCAEVYAPIAYDLSDICSRNGAKYIEFAYDWRLDLIKTSEKLGDLIENSGAKNITLVSHSMGGLIARILLEKRRRKRPTWLGKVKRLLCICTPHQGAPLTFMKCTGLEGDNKITPEDTKLLCDSKYPSAYQLLPFKPRIFVWDVSDPNQKQPLDIYTDKVARRFVLKDSNLAKAIATLSHYNLDGRPKNVEYTFVFGTDHNTHDGFEVDKLYVTPAPTRLGDGTVPAWSAGYPGSKPGIIIWCTPGDHIGIFATDAFKEFFYGYFGMTEAFRSRKKERDANSVVLSPNKRNYAPGEKMEILVIPDKMVERINSTIRIERYDWMRAKLVQAAGRKKIVFQGGAANFIPTQITAPAKPGGYRLTMDGTHKTIEGTHA